MNWRYKLFKVVVVLKSVKLWLDYKRVRNKVILDLRCVKVLYFLKMFNEVRSLSVYWKLVKDVISLRVCKFIGFLKKCDDFLVLSDKEKVGLMNLFFVNIGMNIVVKLFILIGNVIIVVYRDMLLLLLFWVEIFL